LKILNRNWKKVVRLEPEYIPTDGEGESEQLQPPFISISDFILRFALQKKFTYLKLPTLVRPAFQFCLGVKVRNKADCMIDHSFVVWTGMN